MLRVGNKRGRISSLRITIARLPRRCWLVRLAQGVDLMVHVAAAAAVVACSAAMMEAVTLARRLATLPRPIALVGETGVGKRLIARLIHTHSARSGPFVILGGDEVSESTPPPLAGDERRSFGAGQARFRGPFERAQDGTLFLEDLPLWPRVAQSAVLRVLDEGAIAPPGAERRVPLSCGLIAASQRPLDELVNDGRLLPAFRWWIGEFVINVPPLRGRFLDIAALSYHFLDQARAEFGGVPTLLEPEALERLLTYRWPGNVRQLQGAIEWSWVQAAASAADRIRITDLPAPIGRGETTAISVDLDARRELSRWAFERAGHDRKRAALLLGVHPNTIDNHRRAAAR
jgi:two-component system, NtrC family, response regulator HydG